VIQPVFDVMQATQAIDDITYEKGSAVISMIEDYVGETVFRDGVRNYIAAHAYGNAVTDDLWRELDKVAHAPVSDIAHDFTLQDGIPLIRVEPAARGLLLKQSRFALDESGSKAHRWRVPVIAAGMGHSSIWRGVVGPEANAPIDPAKGVILNAGQSGYYRVLYAVGMYSKLVQNFAALEPVDQLGMLFDARMLGYSGDMPLSNLLALAKRATPRLHPHVLTVLAARLEGLDKYYKDLPARADYRSFARSVLNPTFAKVGWTAKRNEASDQPLLRAGLLEALSQLDDHTIVAEANRRFTEFVARQDRFPADERRTLLTIVARHANKATWEKLLQLAKTSTTNVEKERYYGFLGDAVEPALADRALEFALTGDLAPTTRPSIIKRVAEEFPEKAFDFVLAHRDAVMELLEPTARNSYAPDLLSTGQEARLIEKLNAYADKHIPKTARRAAEVVSGQIALAIKVREKRLPEVDRWIANGGP
jgi:aminopeptidase N